MKRVGIVGGGVAGVAAAYFLARAAERGTAVEATLFEANGRLGGIVETVREGGFVVECGPDGWVTEKPWAFELAKELGLEGQVQCSLDAGRVTYIWLDGRLQAMPDGMRMMVPGDMAAMQASDLFSAEAKAAFRAEIGRAEELRARAPAGDESVASFVERHFGGEVLVRVAAPLLSGVLGGDVRTLSVRSVMPAFVAMERQFGSLILSVQARAKVEHRPVFTTLREGMEGLVEGMAAKIPAGWLRRGHSVSGLERTEDGWLVWAGGKAFAFDELLMAAPVAVARRLLRPVDLWMAEMMEMEASSAVVVGFCFAKADGIELPAGFGFLVPPGQDRLLLACTFTDQKFAGRVPEGGRQVRAYFGGKAAERLMGCGNDELAAVARLELGRIIGALPEAVVTVVRRWPRSLPQYGVGHLERMEELGRRVEAMGRLRLLGNGYRGVGVPDLVRDARSAVGELVAGS